MGRAVKAALIALLVLGCCSVIATRSAPPQSVTMTAP